MFAGAEVGGVTGQWALWRVLDLMSPGGVYATNEPLNSTPETHNTLYVN